MLDATRRVRDLAYQIWEAEGCPAGREREHWLEAERRLMTANGPTKAAAKPKPKKVAAKSEAAPVTKAARPKKRA